MIILMITPVLYDPKSPFNHILKFLIEGFISKNMKIVRIVAVNKNDMNNHSVELGIRSNKVKYIKVKRGIPNKNNFMMRFLIDFWTTIRMTIKSNAVKDIDVFFEDLSYCSIIPVLFAKIRKIPIILMVQDIWPDNAVQSDMFKYKGIIYKIFNWIQNQTYKMSDHIITISPDMKLFLSEKGVKLDKIDVIYNWGYSDEINNIGWKNNKFVKKFNLSKDEFHVIYAGNIGKMQNIDVILNAANELKKYKNIRFLIVGDGVTKSEKINKACKLGLSNVKFLSMQSSKIAIHVYSAANVNIIPLVKDGVKTALPSKTAICLSCGKPVILCVEKKSQYAKLITEYSAGIVVEPDDYHSLAEDILRMSKLRLDNRKNSYNCFKNNFTKTENVNKYCEIVSKIANERSN